MSDLKALYQEMILDHGRHPRNFTPNSQATGILEGFNPLCGDRLTLYLVQKENRILQVSFQGTGCAISVASASLMTEALTGKTRAEAQSLFVQFHQLLLGKCPPDQSNKLGKLAVLSGVSNYPARIKCATLAWHTCMGILGNKTQTVTTETA